MLQSESLLTTHSVEADRFAQEGKGTDFEREHSRICQFGAGFHALTVNNILADPALTALWLHFANEYLVEFARFTRGQSFVDDGCTPICAGRALSDPNRRAAVLGAPDAVKILR